MTRDEIIEKMNTFVWYHEIDLGGIITPGHKEFRKIWDQIRAVRSKIDYSGKSVLDICAYDGMFSFEAEKLGASLVVATDCCYRQFRNFLFCREVFGSEVIPYYNIAPHNLKERLDVFLGETLGSEFVDRRFDVVQHLGLLYHVRDPMLSLAQARSVMKTGGYLLLETAGVAGDESKMVFNGVPDGYWPSCGAENKPIGVEYKSNARFGADASFFWCPTILCLTEILRASLFEVIPESIQFHSTHSSKEYDATRIALVAKAVDFSSLEKSYADELKRSYRNPVSFDC